MWGAADQLTTGLQRAKRVRFSVSRRPSTTTSLFFPRQPSFEGETGETGVTAREIALPRWDREGDRGDRLMSGSDLCLPCPTYQSPLSQAVSLVVPVSHL